MLLVTGAYSPEISAAAVQCRAVAARMRGRAVVSVLTTAVTPRLPANERVDDVDVHRVRVDVRKRWSKALASIRLAWTMVRWRRSYDIIHIHGFSQKNVAVSVVGRLLRKPVVLTLHTAGQDDPAAVRRRGRLAYWAFTSPRMVTAVSPQLIARWREAGLCENRVRLVPNGVDTARFRPADSNERLRLRESLGWPSSRPVLLFVGFFSRDKRPELLFRAWQGIEGSQRPHLVFVGANTTGYFEIDGTIGAAMRREATAMGAADRVTFVEPTDDVERYFRAADVFILPSVREAHPLALLEAMACGLPVVATRLPGATDVVIDDGRNGRLFPPDDEGALRAVLSELLADPESATEMGRRAHETVSSRYDIQRTADAWLSAYETVLSAPS